MNRRGFLRGIGAALLGATAPPLPGLPAPLRELVRPGLLMPLAITVRWVNGQLFVEYLNPNEVETDASVLSFGAVSDEGLYVPSDPVLGRAWTWQDEQPLPFPTEVRFL